MDNNKNDLKSVGAFWLKTGKEGNKFYSGEVEIHGKKYSGFLFSNKKDKPNHCDVRLYLINYEYEDNANPIVQPVHVEKEQVKESERLF